ncbi:MAG: YidC/Oxa1 family membrane protein insertase [Candidatus Pacebacteria bacterium]|nr:YidC/Oxa1 family membrane protein insertase [Candidatus Paceibacterota bacterium]
MAYLFQQIFYKPLFNILVFFYQTISLHDLGIAIILTTILIRLILYPFFHKGAKQQMLMQRIQPKVKEIQERHKGDTQKQSEALMALYKEHGVNPFSSILLLLIQLPIMLAFFWVVRSGLGTSQFVNLYSFVSAPQSVNTMFLGIIDLTKPSIIVILCAAAAQFFQARLAIYKTAGNGQPSAAEKIAQQMSFVGPLVTIAIFYSLPSAIGLYWLVTSLFSMVQQYLVNRHLKEKYGN